MKGKGYIIILIITSIYLLINSSFSQRNEKVSIHKNKLQMLIKESFKGDEYSYTMGFLQGIEMEKAEKLIYYESYKKDSSFTVFFLPKYNYEQRKKLNMDSVYIDIKRNGFNNDFSNYIAYFFYLPLVNPSNLDDYHDINIVLPCKVTSYCIENSIWTFMGEIEISKWQEFNEYVYNIIYQFDK